MPIIFKMENSFFRFGVLCAVSLVFCAAELSAVGEKTILLGGTAGWGMIEERAQIIEQGTVRPHPVLLLSSTVESGSPEASPDLSLSFDERDAAFFNDAAGHYRVSVTDHVYAAAGGWARHGSGAALFSGTMPVSFKSPRPESGPLLIEAKNHGALLSAGRNIRNFSIEFWLYPNSMETGEEALTWSATRRQASSSERNDAQNIAIQTIKLIVAKDRLHWNFINFFASPNNDRSMNISLDAADPLTPKTWTHHLLRYNGEEGIIEYIVDGRMQDIKRATTTGREGGEVWQPLVGERGSLVLGKNFNGMIDDFRIFDEYVDGAPKGRYPAAGGRMESAPIDLGDQNSSTLAIDVSGGRVNPKPGGLNEFTRGGSFKFSDDAQIQFFVRAANSPYTLGDQDWKVFESGRPIRGVNGRFVQIAAGFYPSGNRETSPYIADIKLSYVSAGAPKAPQRVAAIAKDGSVELSWKDSGDSGSLGEGVEGYLVYYGTESGVYFGDDSLLGPSPIDIGKRNRISIDNLKNGTLYYFAVSAYNNLGSSEPGAFSREVSARPLRMIE
jgi:hypothetical protein